ncbi:MAG TPA: YIP1 family protein, partial [Methanocella sp.]|nr:YIP1 family protein [Methanocella sp.]
MNFIERVVGMIARPDDTTKDIDKDPRIEEGLMIVGIYLILTVLGTYLSITRIRYTGSITGMDASTLTTFSLIGGIVGAIISVLVGWPIVTGAAHVLSMFFGANGKFYPNMMTLIGYTAIPLIVVTVLSMVLTLLTPVTVVNMAGGIQAATASIFSPLQILGMVLSLLGSIWVAYMMLYAV